jgi:urease accessory protein
MKIMKLLQLTEIAYAIGSAANQNSIETVVADGAVSDVDSLERFMRKMAQQVAFTDGIAALCAYREAMRNSLRGVEEADLQLTMSRVDDVDRNALQLAGRRLIAFAKKNYPNNRLMSLWYGDIREKLTPGSMPVALALIFAAEGLSEEALFSSILYQAMNKVLKEAIRFTQVTASDTQALLFGLSDDLDGWYRRARMMTLEDINSYAQADLFSALHV